MEQRTKRRGADSASIQNWKQLHALCSTDPKRVINLLRQWESKSMQDELPQFNKAALLIDAERALLSPLFDLFLAVELEEARRAQGKDQKWMYDYPYHLQEPGMELI